MRAGQAELQAQGGREKAAPFNSSVYYCWIRHQDTIWGFRSENLKRKTFRVNNTSLQGSIWSQCVLVLKVFILTFITFLVICNHIYNEDPLYNILCKFRKIISVIHSLSPMSSMCKAMYMGMQHSYIFICITTGSYLKYYKKFEFQKGEENSTCNAMASWWLFHNKAFFSLL